MNLTDKPLLGVVTTRDWLHTNDGHNYKAFFGLCSVHKADEVMGCRTGSGQADFVIKIGETFPFVIAGCGFESFHACDSKPNSNEICEIF